MRHDLEVALRAARAGAEVVRDGMTRIIATELKGAVDPVTVTDRASETAIREILAEEAPHDLVLAEEGGGADWSAPRVWIVDPLDGTVNFVHGVPHVSVTVALWDRGVPLVGVVIDVVRGEEFVAVAGEGASLDGKPIRVSPTTKLGDCLLATGFPYDRRRHAAAYLVTVEQALTHARGVRRLGSAALDMAWVASGRFDGYWEHGGPEGVKSWDVAAGLLLVTEAGGRVSDETGRANRLDAVAFVASNGLIHEELRAFVAAHMPPHLL